MLQLSGYQTSEQIFEDAKFVLYRGYRELDGLPVLIKALRVGIPSALDQAALKSELRLTGKLRFNHILKPLALDLSQGALILDYFEGRPPEPGQFFEREGPAGFLTFATLVCEALLEAHQHRIVHQNIRPINLLFDPAAKQVRLLGFGITSLKEERVNEVGLNALTGALAYMSPEQLGRLNRKVGTASDLYSLGITFYELLTGFKPFTSEDPMELVHSHLAREPRHPRALNEQVPPMLAEIVMRLLRKTPEDRYRSLFGLTRDLRECSDCLQRKGVIDSFPLACRDVASQFAIPEKLYGRDRELACGRDLFARVCRGQVRLLVVRGPSGCGKTALVRELRPFIAHAKGYFIQGACERAKHEIPYAPLIAAFHDLVHQILAETPREMELWCRLLAEELGPLAHALIDLVPDLALVLGECARLPPLEINESKTRFQVALLKFLNVFARKRHPLVIFLDDVQWLNLSTLELMRALLCDPQMGYLMVVAGLREEPAQTDKLLFDELTCERETIDLGPIDLLEIQHLLQDSLGTPPQESRPLAEIALARTEGNPLHLILYLRSLHERGLLTYIAKNGAWNWDAVLISARDGNDRNLVRLIADKIARLAPESLRVLQRAACIGSRFSIRLLAIANQQSQSDTARSLVESIHAGLLVPLGSPVLLPDMDDAEELEDLAHHNLEISYEFMHSRVQQAVYETMDAIQSKRTHLEVGELFLAYSRDAQVDELVFGIVNQLNLGSELVHGLDAHLSLARLNLHAGIKSRDSAAYTCAREYLLMAQAQLPEQAREHDYRLWFEIHLMLAEMEYFNGNVAAAEAAFAPIIAAARDLADQAQIYETRVLILINISRLEEAVRVGLEGLRLFGILIAEDGPTRESEIAKHWQEVDAWLASHTAESILALPANENRDSEHIIKLLMQITPPAFNTDQTLFRLCTLLQMQQLVAHGLDCTSAYALATMGILLGMRGDYRRGCVLVEIALAVNERFPDPLVRNRLLFIGANLVNHWCNPVRRDMGTLTRIFHSAEDFGDLAYANYAQLVISHHRWFLGDSLLKILDEAERHCDYASQTRNEAARWTHRFMVHVALNLRGLSLAPDTLDTSEFQTETCIEAIARASYYTGVAICRILQLEVLFLRGAHERAWQALTACAPLIHFCDNLVVLGLHSFYHGLLLARRAAGQPAQQRGEDLVELARIRARFQVWSSHCPENYEHLYHLIAAEEAYLLDRDLEAMRHFQRAYRTTRNLGLRKYEAIANELAARFFLERSFIGYGLHHLQTAIAAYGDWGACACQDDLRTEFDELLRATAGDQRELSGGPSASGDDTLDKLTLLKAAQTISGEIHIDRLLAKMMRFVVENAGAQRGVFIYNDKGRLMIGAEWHVSQREVGIIEEVGLNSRDDLALPVIHYVFRTRADLVISDIQENQQFRHDPYLQKSGVQALLCVPVLRQTELLGMIYLENHLVRGTFTRERLEMLRLLTPQMAVSLENARFIANMAALNENLTREIAERKKAEKALRKAQEIAVANAHQAGKAEFASSVLHNINNVLNTVGVANESMVELVRTSRMGNLIRALNLIKTHRENLGHYLTQDERGKLVPGYLSDLVEVLAKEHEIIGGELEVMTRHIRLMKGIIETQQNHAKGVMGSEQVDLVLLCEDALHLQQPAIERHRVQVRRDYRSEDPVDARKAELTHILINLVKNAVEAMGFQDERILGLTTDRDEQGRLYLEVSDTGVGIAAEDMARMFTHGFTTKQDGHGFGLHYCQRVMAEMGGQITVASEGLGHGARFRLVFGAPS